ncbi:MAG: hypothetical protein AAF726_24660 [Planctomycetota bacterium]
MTLQAKLDEIAASFAKQAPEATRAVMHAHTDSLIASGQADRAIGVGDTAPSFSLDGPDGPIALDDLTSKGPVVLTWFRGTW